MHSDSLNEHNKAKISFYRNINEKEREWKMPVFQINLQRLTQSFQILPRQKQI